MRSPVTTPINPTRRTSLVEVLYILNPETPSLEASEVRLKITLRDGEDWLVPLDYELAIREVYTNVDEEFAKMRVWLAGNPDKRPISRPRRFISNWMNKSGKMRHLNQPLSVVRAVSHDTVARTVETTEEARAHLAKMRQLIKRVA